MCIRLLTSVAIGAAVLALGTRAAHADHHYYYSAVNALKSACVDEGLSQGVCGSGTPGLGLPMDLTNARSEWRQIPGAPSQAQDGVYIEISNAIDALPTGSKPDPTAVQTNTRAALSDGQLNAANGGPPPFPKPRVANLIKEILDLAQKDPKEAKKIIEILENVLQ